MFTTQLSLHYTGSTNTTEMIKDEPHAVTHVKLVLDSLTPAIAKEISREFHDTFFTKDGQIHDHVSQVNIRLREPQQALEFRMVEDMDPQVEMRNVRIPRVTVTKRGEEKDEEPARKSRKVAPTSATLRATLHCLMLPETSQAREFLCRQPGNTFLVDFGDENKQLDFGPEPDDDDDDAADNEEQLNLGEEAPARRLVKPPTKAQVIAALSTQNLELLPKYLVKLTPEQRTEIVDAVDARHAAEKAGSGELSLDELNAQAPLPSYVMNPAELLDAPASDPAAGDVLEEQQKVVDIASKPRKKRAGKYDTSIGAAVKAKRGKK